MKSAGTSARLMGWQGANAAVSQMTCAAAGGRSTNCAVLVSPCAPVPHQSDCPHGKHAVGTLLAGPLKPPAPPLPPASAHLPLVLGRALGLHRLDPLSRADLATEVVVSREGKQGVGRLAAAAIAAAVCRSGAAVGGGAVAAAAGGDRGLWRMTGKVEHVLAGCRTSANHLLVGWSPHLSEPCNAQDVSSLPTPRTAHTLSLLLASHSSTSSSRMDSRAAPPRLAYSRMPAMWHAMLRWWIDAASTRHGC